MVQSFYHILIIGKVWPEPDSSAAGTRMIQLIHLFQNQGWKVTFASAASDSEFAVDLSGIGVEKAVIELNNSSFDHFVKNLQPDIVIFDRFMTEEQFGWRVSEQCPDAIRILDTEDLHCLRAARQNAWKKGKIFEKEDLTEEVVAKREIASIYRCDLSLIISDYEMGLLTGFFNIEESLLHYLPFLLDNFDESEWEKHPDFENRSGFISIGNFLHEPNWNAVLWLKEEIWPLIRNQLPGADLHIYGAYPSQKVFQLHNPAEGFFIKGRAQHSNEIIAGSRVLLAPIRFGAGLKGKLVEAMQCGTPSVTTTIGAEGIAGDFEWSGLIGNDAVSIADAAVQLYEDNSLWTESRINGVKILKSRFNPDKFGTNFISRIADLKNNLSSHRKKNFIGSMLQHHTNLSTKYLSKWIEEKSRVVE